MDELNISQPIRIGRREFDTTHGDLAEIPPGGDIFEVIPVWRDWCLQVMTPGPRTGPGRFCACHKAGKPNHEKGKIP